MMGRCEGSMEGGNGGVEKGIGLLVGEGRPAGLITISAFITLASYIPHHQSKRVCWAHLYWGLYLVV